MWEDEVLKAFLTPSSFGYCAKYIGCWNEKNMGRSSGVARSSKGLVNVA